jgi:VIT1/CCC1 family predicted Fe2+/Mn2+ transporter
MMNIVVIIISGILGATVTFYISDKLKQSAVRSSLLSLIVALFSFFPEILNAYLSKKYTASIYRNLHRNGFF